MSARSSIGKIALAAACIVPLLACGRAPDKGAAEPATVAAGAPQPTPSAPYRAVPDEATRAKLVGWWLRHDQSYMIVIDSIDERGYVEARYLNPQPIHVSRAETWVEDGSVHLLVELTDRNYPGNFYELAFQPDQDMWLGVYHHLGVGEDYEVYFTRYREEGT